MFVLIFLLIKFIPEQNIFYQVFVFGKSHDGVEF